jgi:hypothetical protein
MLFAFVDCERVCTAKVSPVCGSNGKTYDNKCLLQKDTCKDPSIKFERRGKCDSKIYFAI